MKYKITFFSTLTAILLNACSLLPSSSHTLATLDNIEAYPSTTQNIAKLSQYNENCTIEFTGLFKGGKVTERWTFNAQGLVSASSTTEENSTVSSKLLSSKPHETSFDIQHPQTLNNFTKLKNNFSAKQLQPCIG